MSAAFSDVESFAKLVLGDGLHFFSQRNGPWRPDGRPNGDGDGGGKS